VERDREERVVEQHCVSQVNAGEREKRERHRDARREPEAPVAAPRASDEHDERERHDQQREALGAGEHGQGHSARHCIATSEWRGGEERERREPGRGRIDVDVGRAQLEERAGHQAAHAGEAQRPRARFGEPGRHDVGGSTEPRERAAVR
jgi:hypothetical protein